MKKSQLFLGATAFVLAIAGAFASKASNKFSPVTAFITNGTPGSGNFCTVSVAEAGCLTQGAITCKTSNNGRVLFQKRIGLPCRTALKKVGE
jgi:hypothetical protein